MITLTCLHGFAARHLHSACLSFTSYLTVWGVEPFVTHQKARVNSSQSAATLSVVSCAGVTAKVIYSRGAELDSLPQHVGKGKGLEFLISEVYNSHLHCSSLMTPVPLHCIHLPHFF